MASAELGTGLKHPPKKTWTPRQQLSDINHHMERLCYLTASLQALKVGTIQESLASSPQSPSLPESSSPVIQTRRVSKPAPHMERKHVLGGQSHPRVGGRTLATMTCH